MIDLIIPIMIRAGHNLPGKQCIFLTRVKKHISGKCHAAVELIHVIVIIAVTVIIIITIIIVSFIIIFIII